MRVKAVRGAVAISENSADAIIYGTERMMKELLNKNCVEEENIVSVQFTVTGDLTAANPATVFRRLGFSKTPLFCSLEPPFEGSMEKLVRVLLTAYIDMEGEPEPVYIQGAEKLRPDLSDTASGTDPGRAPDKAPGTDSNTDCDKAPDADPGGPN